MATVACHLQSEAMVLSASQFKSAIGAGASRYFAERGFEALPAEDLFQRNTRLANDRHELVEVQFDKHGRSKFVLNFGVVPIAGIVDGYGRLRPPSSVRVADLCQSGRLYRWPWTICWFGRTQDLVHERESPDVEPSLLAMQRLFGQVENWFATAKAGRNIKIDTHAHNFPGVRKASMEKRGQWPPEDWTIEDQLAQEAAGRMSDSRD